MGLGLFAGAQYYEYCIDITNDNACSGWTSTGSATQVLLSRLSRGTTYYWHVRAFYNGGVTYSNGSTSAYRSFTTKD